MKYFAKAIKEEGSKEKSPFLIYNGVACKHAPMLSSMDQSTHTFIIKDAQGKGEHVEWEKVQPARMYLCSADVTEEDVKADRVITEHTPKGRADVQYVKVGELSPDAAWVKEGDQFDEYQKVWAKDDILVGQHDPQWEPHIAKNRPDLRIVLRVKGHCGHFH